MAACLQGCWHGCRAVAAWTQLLIEKVMVYLRRPFLISSIPVDENSVPRLVQILSHSEYVSCMRFIDEHTAVTSCGDKNV